MNTLSLYRSYLVFVRVCLFLILGCCQIAFSEVMVDSVHEHLGSVALMHFNAHKQPNFQLNPHTALSSIRQLRISQGYGDPLYKKFAPSSLIRFFGFTGFAIKTITRQDVVAFNIASYLFPAPYLPDVIGRDINGRAKTSIEANGARVGVFFNPLAQRTLNNIYGILEMDFSGIELGTAYIAKIRHAFGEIIWSNGTFLFGQYYHPLFLRNCFPRTVSFNMGAPFEPQALVPQLRFTQLWHTVEITLVAASEAYIKTWGPVLGFNSGAERSIRFIENAIVPNWHLQLKKNFETAGFIGASIDYKRVVPRLASLNNFKVNEYLDSIIGEIFLHNVFNWGEINLKAVYAENGSNQLLISGFAVKTVDPVTDYRTYTPTACVAAWLDLFWVFYETMSLGCFFGGTYNLGASRELYINPITMQPIVYSLDDLTRRLSYAVRVSPRYSYNQGAFRCGFELVWDSAAFGDDNRGLTSRAQVINAVPVNAFSYLISLDYIF